MAKQSKTKKKNLVVVIILSIVFVALAVGLCFACVGILQKQKDYLLFAVSDNKTNEVIKSSIDNEMLFDTTYTFDIKYVFSDDASNRKNYDFNVHVLGCRRYGLTQDGYAIQLDKLNLTKAFKIEKKKNQFTITIPPAEQFFEIIFADYLDMYGNKVYFYDLCESDYFSLNIISYNRKDNISYKFHLSNKKGENVNVEEIISNNDELFFDSMDKIFYPVEEIEISDDTIIFDGGKND